MLRQQTCLPAAQLHFLGDAEYCGSSGCRFVLNEEYRQSTAPPGWDIPTTKGRRSIDEVFLPDATSCIVKQMAGLPPTDPKVRVDSGLNDMESALVELKVLIGTHRMANDIGETSFGISKGLSDVYSPPVDEAHRNGAPLFFTVTSTNAAGKNAPLQCMLHTLDTTPPDILVTSTVAVQSHLEQLVVDYFITDDSALTRVQYGLSLSPDSATTSSLLEWRDLELVSAWEPGTANHGPMDWFIYEREWLTGMAPSSKRQDTSLLECAQACLKLLSASGCRAFQHEDDRNECLLFEHVPIANTYLRAVHAGERFYIRREIDQASHVEQGTLIIDDLSLEGGNTYYVVFRARNELGYETVASHPGTFIDTSAPETALILNAAEDALEYAMCEAAPSQRCYKLYNGTTNHKVIDGPGSVAVLNGLELGVDAKFATNHRIAACQFDGFKDSDSGLYKVVFGIGTTVCGTDIVDYNDPHEHLIT